ncbi:translation initiation factor IF-2 [Kocuria palustris]|nr:translation initiation factor IF-2 [Kocuria palustris]
MMRPGPSIVRGLRAYSILKDLPKVAPVSGQDAGKKPANRFADMFNKKPGPKPTGGAGNGKPKNRGQNNNNNNNNQQKKPNQPTNEAKPKLAAEVERERAEKYAAMKEKMKAKVAPTTAKQSANKQQKSSKSNKLTVEPVKLKLPLFISVSNLANVMQVPLNDVFAKLEGLGFEKMHHNFILDKENASLVADEYNFEVIFSDKLSDDLFPAPVNEKLLKPRPPVVTIMGHVDHGKTTILDFLRKSLVIDQEFGGITQHIGAFLVITPQSKKKITFLDTPGHAAFLKMRERGAICTDIVILVVAGDDLVMPQTVEAIKHAKKLGVPIIVAVNKCDKPGLKIQKVFGDLAHHGIDVEDYGGDTQCVQVSGKTGLNMDKLEEAVVTLAEMSDLQAEPLGVPAEGWVIELEIQKGFGAVATVLVRRGTVKNGDVMVAGKTYCKVRGMKDEHGKPVKAAGPSTPVQMWGWKEVPESGEAIIQAKNELTAKKVIAYRETRHKEIQALREIEEINSKRQLELDQLKKQEKINQMKMAGLDTLELEQETALTVKTCHYIVKADVFGLAEAIRESVDGLGNDEEITAKVVRCEAGAPTDLDIELAKTLGATIFTFNIATPKAIALRAEQDGVKISEHNIIYRLIEEVTEELQLHLAPTVEIKVLAQASIKGVFELGGKNKKTVKVAGCKVNKGAIKRTLDVRVVRNGDVIYEGHLSSLKHVKDDIEEAKKGNECGLSFKNWDDFKEGDVVEVYEKIEHKRYL